MIEPVPLNQNICKSTKKHQQSSHEKVVTDRDPFNTFEALGRVAWNKFFLGNRASVRGNHSEIVIIVVARFLPVYYSNHTVRARLASLVLVVHEGKFEICGVLDLFFRVWAVFKPVGNIRASAKFVVEFMRVECTIVGFC